MKLSCGIAFVWSKNSLFGRAFQAGKNRRANIQNMAGSIFFNEVFHLKQEKICEPLKNHLKHINIKAS